MQTGVKHLGSHVENGEKTGWPVEMQESDGGRQRRSGMRPGLNQRVSLTWLAVKTIGPALQRPGRLGAGLPFERAVGGPPSSQVLKLEGNSQ